MSVTLLHLCFSQQLVVGQPEPHKVTLEPKPEPNPTRRNLNPNKAGYFCGIAYAGRFKIALKPWRASLKPISNASALKLSQFLSYVSMEGFPGAVSSDMSMKSTRVNYLVSNLNCISSNRISASRRAMFPRSSLALLLVARCATSPSARFLGLCNISTPRIGE